jgi:hypothetical protein
MPFPGRSHAALIHTCHAATLPFSDSAVYFVKVRVADGNIRNASLLLVTAFVEIRVVAGRSRKWIGHSYAVSGRPMLIQTYLAVPMPLLSRAVPWPWDVFFRTAWSWHGRGKAWKRHGICESNTAHWANQMGKTQSKPLAERHVTGTAWYLWISL